MALHASDQPAAAEDRAAADSPGSCRPGISVPDLDEFHQRMIAAGVTCLEEPKVVFGSRLAQYRDPDGLSISVAQSPRVS